MTWRSLLEVFVGRILNLALLSGKSNGDVVESGEILSNHRLDMYAEALAHENLSVHDSKDLR